MKRRGRFRYQPKTWVLLLVVGGLLYWLNAYPGIVNSERFQNDSEPPSNIQVRVFGWPVTWMKQEFFTDPATQETYQQAGSGSFVVFFLDIAICLFILFVVVRFGEALFTPVRRET